MGVLVSFSCVLVVGVCCLIACSRFCFVLFSCFPPGVCCCRFFIYILCASCVYFYCVFVCVCVCLCCVFSPIGLCLFWVFVLLFCSVFVCVRVFVGVYVDVFRICCLVLFVCDRLLFLLCCVCVLVMFVSMLVC